MTPQEKLKAYVYNITRGLVSLKQEHIDAIERIVKQPKAFAKMSKWQSQLSSYEHICTETLTDDEALSIYSKCKSKAQIGEFYKWELYNSDGVKIGELHNVYASLHQLKML